MGVTMARRRVKATKAKKTADSKQAEAPKASPKEKKTNKTGE